MSVIKFIINDEEQEIIQRDHEIVDWWEYQNWPKTRGTLYLCPWKVSRLDLPNNKITFVIVNDQAIDFMHMFGDGVYSYIDPMSWIATGLFANTEFASLIIDVFSNIDSTQMWVLFDGLNDRYAGEFIPSAMEQFNQLYLNPTQEQADILEAWLNNQNDMIIDNQHVV